MSKDMKTSDWVRGLRVIFGFLAIAAGVIVLAMPGLAVLTLLFLLSFALFFLGIVRIVHSWDAKFWSKGHRALHAVAGVVAVILGAVFILFPGLGATTLVFLLAIAVLFYGIMSLVIGGSGVAGVLSTWRRALLVVVGALSVLLSLIVIAFPGVGLLTLAVMLSVSFLLNGIESIMSGIE